MERIKFEDLPKEMKVSREEMGRIYGGFADKDPVVLGKSGGTAGDEVAGYVDNNSGKWSQTVVWNISNGSVGTLDNKYGWFAYDEYR